MGNASTKEMSPRAYAPPQKSGSSTSGLQSSSQIQNGSSRSSIARMSKSERRKKEQENYTMIIDPKEMVDGGYLFPQGVYSGPQDFKVSTVRELIICRRLAPFYKGLDYCDPSMSDNELLRAIGITPLGSDSEDPSPQKLKENSFSEPAVESESDSNSREQSKPSPEPGNELESVANGPNGDCAIDDLDEALDNFEISNNNNGTNGQKNHNHNHNNANANGNGNGPLAKSQSRSASLSGMRPHRRQSSMDNAKHASKSRQRANTTSILHSSVDAQKLELEAQALWLYRNTHECPICFLLYPRLNTTRCCSQDICTECFVQIKRHPPHPPHGEPAVPSAAQPPSDVMELVSEPACCPYCQMPNCGVIFVAPPFEWGIKNPKASGPNGQKRLSSSSASPAPEGSSNGARRMSYSHTHEDVVTTDIIRPDWESKLASARRKLMRKSVAARALHQSSLLPLHSNGSRGNGVRVSGTYSRSHGSQSGNANGTSKRTSSARPPQPAGNRAEASAALDAIQQGSSSANGNDRPLKDYLDVLGNMSPSESRAFEKEMLRKAIRDSMQAPR